MNFSRCWAQNAEQTPNAGGYSGAYGKSTDQSFEDTRKSAIEGNPQAQYNLGCSYHDGDGVNKDSVEAVKWWLTAAKQGHVLAQYNLSVCYMTGDGVAKDLVESGKWNLMAAKQGLADAQCNAGIFYENGQGVERNPAEAARWYVKAANQGHAGAQLNLARLYGAGRGVSKDSAESAKLARMAAEAGFRDAQLFLGLLYDVGMGVPKDCVEAYKWFNLASSQGSEDARKYLLQDERWMTPDQIAEAQRLSRQFTPTQRKTTNPGVPSATGTGFFITTDGYLLTNEHVVRGATNISVVTAFGTLAATLIKTDKANDIALLKVNGTFATIPVASSRDVRLGKTVFTIGFPNVGLQGFSPKLAKGEIASLSGAQDDARYFQISVPVQPGNSGGPLVDANGNVVGIVSAKLDLAAAIATSGTLPENVNYAVKSSFFLSFLESMNQLSNKLILPNNKEQNFEDAVNATSNATALIIVYN